MQLSFPFYEPNVTDFSDPKLCAEFDKALAELDEKLRPRIEAFEESERLTEKDFQMVIY